MKLLFLCLALVTSAGIKAQNDSTAEALKFSGYAEAYYSYDFAQPADHLRPSFLYSHNRHNEFNLNLGFLKAAYQSANLRANLALGVGTYMNANYAAESATAKLIYEANAGVKISKKHDLWIDAGIFASHIGFESAIGKDCWTLTRSIGAENSPYYESGAKLTYTTKDSRWLLSALVLNGWQHISRPDGNNTIAVGHQVTFKPSKDVTINSSSFIGNDKPDSVRKMRYFHDLYGIFQLSELVGITAGFDIGIEQKEPHSNKFNSWYSPVMLVRITPSSKQAVTGRIEYFRDPNQVIISTGNDGLSCLGYSINYDYLIRPNAVVRIEARDFTSKHKVFSSDGLPSGTNFCITSSLAISF